MRGGCGHLASLLAAAACCWSLTSSAPAIAAPAQIAVSPALIEVRATPGEHLTQGVTLTTPARPDAAAGATTVQFEHADLRLEQGSGAPLLIEDGDEATDAATSTRRWFSVRRATIQLSPGRPRSITLDIRVPADAVPGTHLGAALFRTETARSTGGQLASARSGPLVFIHVAGGTGARPALVDPRLPRIVGSGPIPVDASVRNDGDTSFAYEGAVRLDGPGDADDRAELPSRVVTPGLRRDLRDADGVPKLGGRHLRAGRHRVVVDLRAEPAGTVLRRSYVVWVVPPAARVLLAVLALLLLLGAWQGLRRLHVSVRARRARRLRPRGPRGPRGPAADDAGTGST